MQGFRFVDPTGRKTKVAIGSLTAITAVSWAVATFDDSRVRSHLWESQVGNLQASDSVYRGANALFAGGTATLVAVDADQIVGRDSLALSDMPLKFYG